MRMQPTFSAALVVAMGCTIGSAAAQDAPEPKAKAAKAATKEAAPAPSAPDAEDGRDRQVMERFKSVLERTPRRGTALDRVYGYHVERGTLDALLADYSKRVKDDPNDGQGWLLLGLFEAQRGLDAAAVEALRMAEKHRPDDALPAYYLGQALVLVGQPDAAAEAFERALARKPQRTDLLEIYQALGRVHQRAHRSDKALEVWTRLEAMFPDDIRVQEQIASALAEEEQTAQALTRYEKLAGKVTDRYRQVQLQLEAAALKVRLGKTTDALADFEKLLGKLDPDSWLAREVRRKVEDVFLRRDDLAGLAKYYESWITKTPDDVEAMSRLGRIYGQLGKAQEAKTWLDKAVKLAPSRKDLRLALIELLRQRGDIAGAASQFDALQKNDPNDPDIIREWGRMLLADGSKPEAERKKAAGEIWKRLVKDDAKDPVAIAQAADLFRQANLVDDAIALYKRAIALAPAAPQYREYLGEYYHHLKRSPEALATWRQTVEGDAHTAKNLGRLGEVMAGFGYRTEALEPLTEAVKLDGDDLDLRLKRADVLLALEKPKDADEELALAEKIASDDDQAEAVLTRRIKAFQASNTLATRIEELAKALATKPNDAKGWTRLALFSEANGKVPEAVQAATKATQADPKSVQAWTVLGRLHETSGNLLSAADANRTLASLDRRARTDYLTNIAKLEARLGRRDSALKAGRDLLAAAPGNPEHDQFFAELCFSLGEPDEGLEALRRSVRANPSDPKVMLTLAENLARQFRNEEAIELYWRAFEKTNDIEGKMSVVSRLTDQYLQRNQFDRLLARLERELREQDRQREKSLCLSTAYQASGDFGTARAELEKLLGTNTRDVQLLSQLSGLAEAEGDLSTAAKYLKQAVEITPSAESTQRLAQLYFRAGEATEAEAIWARLADDGKDNAKTMGAIDSLLTHGKPETVLGLTDRLLVKNPGDWELLYREGVALMLQEKPADASRRFNTLLDLKISDEEPSSQVKARTKSSSGVAGARMAQRSASLASLLNSSFPLQTRLYSVSQIRAATKLDSQFYNSYGNSLWVPGDFGQARMAAIAWLWSAARTEKKGDEWEKNRFSPLEKPISDLRVLWDLYYAASLAQRGKDIYRTAHLLAKSLPGDTGAQWAFLTALAARTQENASRPNNRSDTDPKADHTLALPAPEIDLALKCFDEIHKRRSNLLDVSLVANLATELKRAKRDAEADRLYRDLIKNPSSEPQAQGTALQLAAERGEVDELIRLGDRYTAEALKKQPGFAESVVSTALARAIGKCAEEKKFPDALRLLDYQLSMMQRPDVVAARVKSKTFGNPYGSMNRPYYQSWLGKKATSLTIDFPLPNVYFDFGAILVLRTTYENYKKADVLSDLLGHFRKQKASAKPSEQLYPSLALGYLLWWSDDKDEALQVLSQATQNAATDIELKLSLAELHSARGEPADALELADSIEPLDQKTTQRRELLALRLSVLAGDVGRAQQAAERLFGLRLDSETQVQLASQMNQLGQHDLAEAVLARARRRAGGSTATLVSLMNQYQRQGKSEPALQLANQILRASGGSIRAYTPYNNDSDSARNEAIQVIKRSGKLSELVERAEAQLKVSPKSAQLLQTLVDYYQALDEKEKMKATYKRLIDVRPDDAKMRFQIGLQLQRTGDSLGAVEQLKAAIKKEPALLAQRYWDVQNAFQQADKNEELADLFDQIDLKSMRSNYYVITNLVSNFVQNEKQRPLGMRLFKKAWNDLPESRADLIGNFYNEEIWRMPEMYDYARQGIIPTSTDVLNDPWSGVSRISAYGGGGHVYGLIDPLLEASARQNKLEELRKEIEAAIKKSPEWQGGKALLGLIDIRNGRIEAGKKALKELSKSEPPMPGSARMLIGQALDSVPDLLDLEISFFEDAVKSGGEQGLIDEFEYGPARRLVDLYKKAKRGKEGRDILLKYGGKDSERYNYDPSYAAYQRINNNITLASTYFELGYPADAARYYAEVLDDNDALVSAQNWGGNIEEFRRQAASGMARALSGVQPETRLATLRAILTPKPDTPLDQPALDLVLLAYPRDLEKAAVTCLFAESLKSSASDKKSLEEVRATLGALQKQRPDDLSVAIANALVAATEKQVDPFKAEVERLVALMAKHPLEPMEPTARANARQRLQAHSRLALWLVARECRKHDQLKKSGAMLEAEAREGARRQSDNRWTLAILREAGQEALDAGNAAEAEKLWREMLKLVLTNPGARPAKPASARPKVPTTVVPKPTSSIRTRPSAHLVRFQAAASVPAAQLVPAAPAPLGTSTNKAAASIVTLDRFSQALQIAKLAAERGMIDLSLEAVSEALSTGPPVKPVAIAQGNSRIMRSGNSEQTADNVAPLVEQTLSALEVTWRKKQAPASKVYAGLRAVVFPSGRPDEVFLYTRPLNGSLQQGPSSVGSMLVRWAVDAGQAEVLIKDLESRQAQPLAAVPAKTLLALVALAMKNNEATKTRLTALHQEVKKNLTFHTVEQACAAALPAMEVPEVASTAKALLEEAIRPAADSGSEEPAGSLLLKLARFELKHKDDAAAKKHLSDYEAKQIQAVSRYSGDYSVYRRRQVLHTIATEYANAGRLSEALDYLGQFTDAPPAPTNYGDVDRSNLLRMINRMISQLPPAERYRLLKAWVLPDANRATVRHLVSTTSRTGPTDTFATSPSSRTGFASPTLSLIEAARELKKLDELSDAIAALAAKKTPNADMANVLIQIARGRGADALPWLKSHLEELKKPVPQGDNQPRNTDQAIYVGEPEALLAHMVMEAPETASVAEGLATALIEKTHNAQQGWFTGLLQSDLAKLIARRNSARPPGPDPGLTHWFSTSGMFSWNVNSLVDPIWLESEGIVSHIAGAGQQSLYLRYPLTGTFEVSADVWEGGWAEGALGFHGVCFEPVTIASSSRIWTMGDGNHVGGTAMFNRREAFNRLTIQCSPKSVKYLVNGHLFHEEKDPSETSPWLSLVATMERRAAFKNVEIKGSPVIPKSVKLVDGTHFDGWATIFGESRTLRLPVPERATSEEVNQESPEAPTWHAAGGELVGRKREAPGAANRRSSPRSLISYLRPMLDGDTVAYEFWYEPGVSETEPALDRLTFVLDAEKGVRLRWLAQAQEDPNEDPAQPPKFVDEPQNRRGPAKLPLKAKAWNKAALAYTQGKARLTLNDQLIYERDIEPTNSRAFGFSHDAIKTEAKVRSVILTGQWPEALPQGKNDRLFARKATSAPGPNEVATRQEIIGERYLVESAEEVCKIARAQSPAARFETLLAWVLPSKEHTSVRLHGAFTPTNPAPLVASRGDRGGRLIAPALDLLQVAKEIGKLDELADRVAKLQTCDPVSKRGQLALTAAIERLRGNPKQALAAITSLVPLQKELGKQAPDWKCWPEVIAAIACSDDATLRPECLKLIDDTVRQADWSIWGRFVTQQRAIIRLLDLPESTRPAAGGQTRSDLWASVVGGTSSSFGRGHGWPTWVFSSDAWTHYPSHEADQLYLKTPLTGDFELTCEVTPFDYREIRVGYAGTANGLRFDKKTHDTFEFGREKTPRPIAGPAFDKIPDWLRFRLAVKGNQYEAFIEDRKLSEQTLPVEPEPWVAIVGTVMNMGTVRNLRISGDPTIPEVLKLSARPSLFGWLDDYYPTINQSLNPLWRKSGDEIVGRQFVNEPPQRNQYGNEVARELEPIVGSKTEAILKHHRPLFEDGELAYEFFYEPGKTHVHPALDRLTFLLDPDGINIHWLTDAAWERTGLLPDNSSAEPKNRRGPAKLPLKPGAWNKLTIKLKGDQVVLNLNGEDVYERLLEPTNRRDFGLFHYADETTARVRNVTYRGNWPRTLAPELRAAAAKPAK